MDFKEQIVDRAMNRAMHARGVVMAAGELQADGKISVEDYVEIANVAINGYPYRAQEELERALARAINIPGEKPGEIPHLSSN